MNTAVARKIRIFLYSALSLSYFWLSACSPIAGDTGTASQSSPNRHRTEYDLKLPEMPDYDYLAKDSKYRNPALAGAPDLRDFCGDDIALSFAGQLKANSQRVLGIDEESATPDSAPTLNPEEMLERLFDMPPTDEEQVKATLSLPKQEPLVRVCMTNGSRQLRGALGFEDGWYRISPDSTLIKSESETPNFEIQLHRLIDKKTLLRDYVPAKIRSRLGPELEMALVLEEFALSGIFEGPALAAGEGETLEAGSISLYLDKPGEFNNRILGHPDILDPFKLEQDETVIVANQQIAGNLVQVAFHSMSLDDVYSDPFADSLSGEEADEMIAQVEEEFGARDETADEVIPHQVEEELGTRGTEVGHPESTPSSERREESVTTHREQTPVESPSQNLQSDVAERNLDDELEELEDHGDSSQVFQETGTTEVEPPTNPIVDEEFGDRSPVEEGDSIEADTVNSDTGQQNLDSDPQERHIPPPDAPSPIAEPEEIESLVDEFKSKTRTDGANKPEGDDDEKYRESFARTLFKDGENKKGQNIRTISVGRSLHPDDGHYSFDNRPYEEEEIIRECQKPIYAHSTRMYFEEKIWIPANEYPEAKARLEAQTEGPNPMFKPEALVMFNDSYEEYLAKRNISKLVTDWFAERRVPVSPYVLMLCIGSEDFFAAVCGSWKSECVDVEEDKNGNVPANWFQVTPNSKVSFSIDKPFQTNRDFTFAMEVMKKFGKNEFSIGEDLAYAIEADPTIMDYAPFKQHVWIEGNFVRSRKARGKKVPGYNLDSQSIKIRIRYGSPPEYSDAPIFSALREVRGEWSSSRFWKNSKASLYMNGNASDYATQIASR